MSVRPLSSSVRMFNIVSASGVCSTLRESDLEDQARLSFFSSLRTKKSFATISKTRRQCNQRYKSPGAEARCSSQLNMQHSSGIVKNHWTKNESLPSSLPTKTPSLPLCFSLLETNQRKGGDWEEGERERAVERENWDEMREVGGAQLSDPHLPCQPS